MTKYARKTLTRRTLCLSTLAGLAIPRLGHAASAQEITWDDLIPAHLPYPEIIGEGDMDVVNDTWRPIYDENATKFTDALDGAYIKMPGYIIPLELNDEGVTEFLLVPYVGACIHVPPPPPNQLVLVQTETPWPSESLWDAVWVTGKLNIEMVSGELADSGYTLAADEMEIYEWE